jgi:signal transduction histidine kinase
MAQPDVSRPLGVMLASCNGHDDVAAQRSVQGSRLAGRMPRPASGIAMTGGSGQGGSATLADVLITDELARRPSPAPDLRAENDALHALAQRIAQQPRAALDAIATVASQLCRCGSAGLTVLETLASGEEVVRWVALAGELRRHVGTSVPRHLSMSDVCLDCNAPQLFSHPSRYFTYLADMAPPVVEALVIPVHVEGRAFGTILAVAHEQSRKFDREDVRLLTSLANFSAALLEARERERSTIAELERASRAKDEFLATVSHELRTPLTAVLGWTRLLITDRLDHDMGRRAIEVIDRNAEILSRLVSDLLDVSRIIMGRMALTVRPVDLVRIIAASIDAMRPALEAKGIDLAVTLADSETWVLGDGARLQQVMWNLLSNAVKFTPNGGRIRVDLVKTDRVARITVTDTGRGIRPEFLPRLFEPFEQADRTFRRVQEGLGLGLAIVRHLVELHGGTVVADSPGEARGATFVVELSLTARPDLSARADPDHAVSEVRQLLGLRILIVEHDLDTREMLATALANDGADVIAVNSAHEAQRVLRSFVPHIMLFGGARADQDGFALIKTMRRDPVTAGIRCVALTGYGGAEDRNEALAAGFDRHITKPVDPAALVRLLADLVGA